MFSGKPKGFDALNQLFLNTIPDHPLLPCTTENIREIKVKRLGITAEELGAAFGPDIAGQAQPKAVSNQRSALSFIYCLVMLVDFVIPVVRRIPWTNEPQSVTPRA